MPGCSLCGGPLCEEGGAVLFTDLRGIPFEVCGVCEKKIDLLRHARDEAEAGRALEYISECARNLGRRDVYDLLADFIQGGMPGEGGAAPEAGTAEPAAAGAPEDSPGACRPDAADAHGDAGGIGKLKPCLLGVILVGILVLVFIFCGAPIR